LRNVNAPRRGGALRPLSSRLVAPVRVAARLLPLLLLLGYGAAFAGRALGRGLLAYDDHPGQLYRLHHAIERGLAPWHWNPGWWAGYAELQFYPPGFAYAGALLHRAAAGGLTPESAYQVLLWVTYLLPGVATYAFLARAGRGWLALPAAFVALTLSAQVRSGVEEGVRWGLVAARLGWGLLPLLGVALAPWIEGRGRPSRLAAPLLAAIGLTHPAHAPLGAAMVLLGAWCAPGPRPARLCTAARVLAIAAGLAAFWLVPLVARLPLASPLAWGDVSLGGQAARLLAYPLLVALAAGAALGWLELRGEVPPARLDRFVLGLAPVGVVLLLVDGALAALGILWLPPDRVADSAVLALLLAASTALALAAGRLSRVPSPVLGAVALAGALGLGGLALEPQRGEPALTVWPGPRQWPREEEIVRGTRLDALWQALRTAPPGRILFLRSGVPLEFRPEWWRPHSHLTALTPLRTGRDIVGGTFTHPSPVASYLYAGRAGGQPIGSLAEQLDGVSLLGRPLQQLGAADLGFLADRLRISAIVALEEDLDRLGALAASPDFSGPASIGPFRLYVSVVPRPAPEAVAPAELVLVLPDHGGGWAGAGVAYSPLWRARGAAGALRTRAGPDGILEIEALPGQGLWVGLTYRPGLPEWGGVAITALTLGAVAVASWRARRRAPR
jgi:hypothetical protein